MNNILFKVCLWTSLFLIGGETFAQVDKRQYHMFPQYSDIMLEKFNVTCKIPSKFIDQKSSEPWGVRLGKSNLGFIYSPIIQSKDKECIIFYPIVPFPVNNETIVRNNIMAEIATAFDIPRDSIDANNYLTVLAGKEARNIFNADSIFFYDIPLDKPYREKYEYCKGIVISKRNRPALLLKLFFTEKGKKEEGGYIGSLKKTIWYEDLINEAN